jgi:hypothetical protein
VNSYVTYIKTCLPHLLCFSEHHLSQFEADFINIENYSIGAKYCRWKLQRGCDSISIQSHLQFNTLNLDKYCVDQDNEVCALQPVSTFLNISILVIWGLRGIDVTLLGSLYSFSFPNSNLTFEWRTLLTQTRLW